MLINVISRLGSILIGYVTIIYINSKYSFDIYGEYILFVTYGLIISTLAVFGLDSSLIANNRFNDRTSTQLLFVLLLITSAISLLISWIFCMVIGYKYGVYLALFAMSSSSSQIIQTVFLIKDKNNIYAISAYILEQSLFLTILFLYNELTQFHIIHAATTSYVLSFLLLFMFASMFNLIKINGLPISLPLLRNIYRESLYFVGSNIVETLANSVDKILIGKLINTSFLGIYSNLDKLSRLTLLGFTSISPIIQKKFSVIRNKGQFISYYRRMAVISGIFSLPLTFGLFYFRECILELFSKELLVYYKLLAILLLLRLVQYSTGFKAVALKMTGLSRYDMYAKISKLCISTLSIILLSRIYGERGFIIALFGTTIMYILIQFRFLSVHNRVKLIELDIMLSILLQLAIYMISSEFGEITFVVMELLYVAVMLKYTTKKYHISLDEIL